MVRWIDRPKTRAEDFGRPMRCPNEACEYGYLKLPGAKMPVCPNCGGPLVPAKRKRDATS